MRFLNRWLAVILLAVGCAGNNHAPETASSSSNPAFAQLYAGELDKLVVRIEAQREAASGSIAKMEQFAVQLGPSDPETVAHLYLMADEEGRSEAYANQQNEGLVILTFFTEEDLSLSQRIASSTEYAAKQKGCDVQLTSAAQRGLQRGIQEHLEKRRRATSSAQQHVQYSKDKLGTKATSLLPDQLDQISLTSYIVYIGLETDELRLARQAERISSIRATLEDHRRVLAAEEKPDAEALQRTDAALVALSKQETRTQLTLQDVEARRTQLRQDYESVLEALVASARHQQAASGTAS